MRLTEQEICALAMEAARFSADRHKPSVKDDPEAYAKLLHSYYCRAKESYYRHH